VNCCGAHTGDDTLVDRRGADLVDAHGVTLILQLRDHFLRRLPVVGPGETCRGDGCAHPGSDGRENQCCPHGSMIPYQRSARW
jgi:hypothetical protein